MLSHAHKLLKSFMESFIFCAVDSCNVETYYVKNLVPVSWLFKSFLSQNYYFWNSTIKPLFEFYIYY